MFFKGDLIITDPCYFVKDEDWEGLDTPLEDLGLSTSIMSETLYGDWSCSVFNSDTNEEIGQFCADAGIVCVCLLSDILKYDPKFQGHINKPWAFTWIKNFVGDVEFEILKSGEYEDSDLHVVGRGNINFKSIQTGA